VDSRRIRTIAGRLGAVQIDSVNVLVRSHYLPLFSRLGPYKAALLDRAVYERRELFEYWGHEASLLPVELHALLRWRMDRAARGETWKILARFAKDRSRYVQAVYDEVATRGPLGASELADPGPRGGPWWGWAQGKRALEWLFSCGRVSTAGRRHFERIYDLTERVLPPPVLAAPVPPEAEAQRALLLIAAGALGVATARDLADYFRFKPPEARIRVGELVEEGRLVAVGVEGFRDAAYVLPTLRVPRRIDARALLSPFDSLVWERTRTERLFGFRFRLELYTPAPQRVYGYYVLPFLLGEKLVARVSLKADRPEHELLVPGAFLEPGASAAPVAEALAIELRSLAAWLGLERIRVGARGSLHRALRKALRPH
jgi:uncharacterized protein YcaQ